VNNNLRGRDTPPAVREITNTNKIFSRYFVPTTKSTNSNNANTSYYTRIEMTFLLLGDWILLVLMIPAYWMDEKEIPFEIPEKATRKGLRILRTELTIKPSSHHKIYFMSTTKGKQRVKGMGDTGRKSNPFQGWKGKSQNSKFIRVDTTRGTQKRNQINQKRPLKGTQQQGKIKWKKSKKKYKIPFSQEDFRLLNIWLLSSLSLSFLSYRGRLRLQLLTLFLMF